MARAVMTQADPPRTVNDPVGLDRERFFSQTVDQIFRALDAGDSYQCEVLALDRLLHWRHTRLLYCGKTVYDQVARCTHSLKCVSDHTLECNFPHGGHWLI